MNEMSRQILLSGLHQVFQTLGVVALQDVVSLINKLRAKGIDIFTPVAPAAPAPSESPSATVEPQSTDTSLDSADPS